MLGDTIAAISTPHGRGGVALIRVSGPDAFSICDRMFSARNGKAIAEQTPRMAIRGDVFSVEPSGERVSIDDGLVTAFHGPASFTGEDTVEISCHGGVLLTQTVLASVLASGARPAEAGEFTRRAFLNGKLGLSAAEALGSILEAQTHAQITLAHSSMDGRIEAACREIYDSICAVLSGIYARIDYPDEDLADMSREEMIEALRACKEKTDRLMASYKTGHAVAEGISTVICGKPNVGKSSIYNRLVGRDAAIVTDIEGTTRDVLCETVSMGRVMLRLFDTAGLHETENVVERIGIERTKGALANAELVLAVFDGSRVLDGEDLALMDELSMLGKPVIAIVNKSDLADHGVTEQIKARFAHTVCVSAETGEGMEALSALVEQLFMNEEINLQNDVVLSNARQHAAAYHASLALGRALEALLLGAPIELSCTDAEEAMAAIAELDGRAVTEDIVARIFSHFCVGK